MSNTDKIYPAFIAMQAQVQHAVKNAVNPHLKNGYADLASVMNVSREPLAANGLAITQTGAIRDGKQVLISKMVHISGQDIESKMVVFNEKGTAQGMGSGWTYARRYSWAALVGIASEDDDGNDASNRDKARGKARGGAAGLKDALKDNPREDALEKVKAAATRDELVGIYKANPRPDIEAACKARAKEVSGE